MTSSMIFMNLYILDKFIESEEKSSVSGSLYTTFHLRCQTEFGGDITKTLRHYFYEFTENVDIIKLLLQYSEIDNHLIELISEDLEELVISISDEALYNIYREAEQIVLTKKTQVFHNKYN